MTSSSYLHPTSSARAISMLVKGTQILALSAILSVVTFNLATADLFMNTLSDDTATVNGGGTGQTAATDFLGVVTSVSPLQVNGLGTNLSSGFSPALGDVIGRDLNSTGFNFTGDSISWTINIPAIDPNYIAGTFDISASFDASLGFLGNTFGATQPNALDFSLLFDGNSQDTFQAQSGTHTAASLASAFTNGAPVSVVEVVVTFPNGNSFDAGSEEFHIFADSLTIDYSYEFTAVPEPGTAGLLALAGLGGFIRRRKS